MPESKKAKTEAAAPAKKKKTCTQKKCKKTAVNQGYCRLHYLQNWKKIRLNERIKAEKRLNAYVDHLAKKYPKDYLEIIKEGIDDPEKFKETIAELEVTDSEPETDREFIEKLNRKIGGE